MSGKIQNLYIKPKHGAPMEEVSEVAAVDGMGLNGDTSFGRSKRQVLLIEQETLAEFGLVPGQLRENGVVTENQINEDAEQNKISSMKMHNTIKSDQ